MTNCKELAPANLHIVKLIKRSDSNSTTKLAVRSYLRLVGWLHFLIKTLLLSLCFIMFYVKCVPLWYCWKDARPDCRPDRATGRLAPPIKTDRYVFIVKTGSNESPFRATSNPTTSFSTITESDLRTQLIYINRYAPIFLDSTCGNIIPRTFYTFRHLLRMNQSI